jgi:hypothetical protein
MFEPEKVTLAKVVVDYNDYFKEEAEALDSIQLYKLAEDDGDLAWDYLNALFETKAIDKINIPDSAANGVRTRTNLKTIKENVNRRKQLKKYMKDEDDNFYINLYTAELDLLDLYAKQVLLEMMQADKETLALAREAIKNIEEEKAAKMAEANKKRKAAMAAKK